MDAREEIASFLTDFAGERALIEPIEPFMDWLQGSDEPAAIEFCDAVCAVLRRKDLSVQQRADELRPIIMRLLKLLKAR